MSLRNQTMKQDAHALDNKNKADLQKHLNLFIKAVDYPPLKAPSSRTISSCCPKVDAPLGHWYWGQRRLWASRSVRTSVRKVARARRMSGFAKYTTVHINMATVTGSEPASIARIHQWRLRLLLTVDSHLITTSLIGTSAQPFGWRQDG